MGKTKIEWTDDSWNPIRAENLETGGVGHFCARVSDGCRNCYAERLQPRLQNPVRYAAQDAGKVRMFLDRDRLVTPLRQSRPRYIFVCSMTDLFYEGHPDEWIDEMFAVMALAPQHTFLVLTKRIARARAYLDQTPPRQRCTYEEVYNAMGSVGKEALGDRHPYRKAFPLGMPWPLPNVYLGVSAEDQKTAEARIPDLLMARAARRFLSAEPLLGGIDLVWLHFIGGGGTHLDVVNGRHGEPDTWQAPAKRLDWVIAGGESGPKARPMHPDWVRKLRDQCQAAGVAFHFKQWGEWAPADGRDQDDLQECRYGEFHAGTDWIDSCLCPFGDRGGDMYRVGKKAAGRMLDGEIWDQRLPMARDRETV
ncbi:MAG: phage Gp37/Gp68 family protein [Rhodovibrio sp.]|nr:phage Gp37/Gp68 family protein [Rhodovibrio sp.]